jgi:hypothetical protein
MHCIKARVYIVTHPETPEYWTVVVQAAVRIQATVRRCAAAIRVRAIQASVNVSLTFTYTRKCPILLQCTDDGQGSADYVFQGYAGEYVCKQPCDGPLLPTAMLMAS